MKLKRMAALLLSAAMVAGLAGCGDAASESTSTAAPTEAAEAPETAAPSVAETAASADSITSEVTAETEPEIDYSVCSIAPSLLPWTMKPWPWWCPVPILPAWTTVTALIPARPTRTEP